MKKKKKDLFMAFAAICAGFTFASCSNDIVDVAGPAGQLADPTRGVSMNITKVGTSEMTNVTRASATEVGAWATAPDKNIGVSVYSSADGTEAMKTGSVNMKWTYNDASDGWDAQTALNMFPGDEGIVTAYYPYGESIDPKAIDIDCTKDYMYALIGDNKAVNYGSPQTDLLMNHANAQLRVNLIRKGYAGVGTISSFTVKGSKFASAGKLNSLTGVVSDFIMTPELTGINEGTLADDISATPTAKIEALYTWFVPVSDAAAPVTFDATVDGLKLRYTTSQQFLAGKRYTFNLALTSSLAGELMLTSVDIDPWTDENGEGDMELFTPAEKNPIDLGLPSGLKWAAGNLGADEPQQSGLFFAWGETTGYENGSGHVFDNSHYTASSISTNLTLAQDAANVRLGGSWRMPTKEDNLELCANCFAEWTTNYDGTGKAGVIFYSTTSNATGKGYYKGAWAWMVIDGTYYTNASQPGDFVAYTLATPHIFIPAAGFFNGSASLSSEGAFGYIWSSSRNTDTDAIDLDISNNGVEPQDFGFNRYFGMPVRAVLAE